jgi:CheY-like chemotaxis protein
MMKKFQKILLVDDDEIANFYNQMIIEDMQIAHVIVVKTNGAEAMKFLEDQCWKENSISIEACPEIIFLDVNMPVMNGLEFLAELNKKHPVNLSRTRVVMLTSSSNSRDLETAQTLGIKAYLNKPLTEEKIHELLSDDMAA